MKSYNKVRARTDSSRAFLLLVPYRGQVSGAMIIQCMQQHNRKDEASAQSACADAKDARYVNVKQDFKNVLPTLPVVELCVNDVPVRNFKLHSVISTCALTYFLP